MCGIIGWITSGRHNYGFKLRRDFSRQMLIADAVRGPHATGVFYALENGTAPGWLKQCVPGQVFVDTEAYAKIDAAMDDYRFLVGHNRWATVGDAGLTDNAHPFSEGPITLVHNGTLTGDGGLKTKQKDLGVEVDSHALCHNLALHDPVEVLEGISGAFALVWFDNRDRTINLARNAQRPLWTYSAEHSDTMFFASERGMMEWVLDRNNGMPHQSKSVSKMLPTGVIHKYREGTLAPEEIKFRLYIPPAYTDNWHGSSRRSGGAAHFPKQGSGSAKGGRIIRRGNAMNLDGVVVDSTGITPAANLLLNQYGYDKTDRLPFVPLQRNGHLTIGTISRFDVPAFCINVLPQQHKDHEKQMWTVRPVGIRHVRRNDDRGTEDEVLMVRVVSHTWHDNKYRYGAGYDTLVDNQKQLSLPEVPPVKKPERVNGGASRLGETYPAGPEGIELGAAAWNHCTRHGCCDCSTVPLPKEAKSLVWLQWGKFRCAQCALAHRMDNRDDPVGEVLPFPRRQN